MRSPLRVRHSIAAGLVDSALASLATFLIGLYATRQLSLDELGVYGLAFSGFILAASVPAQLVFTPAELALLRLPTPRQMAAVPASLRLGFLPGLVASVGTFAVVALVERDVPGVVPIAVSGLAAAVVSPAQDHVRRMLHQVTRNFSAAAVSLMQLAVAGASIVGLGAAGVQRVWIPFSALAIANVVSGALGMLLVARGWAGADPRAFRMRHLTRVGGWLLMAGSVEMGGGFAALTLLSAEAGSAAVGQFEATRVLSQPLFVLATGLLSVLNPRVMRACQARNRPEAARYSAAFLGVFGTCGLLYLLVAGLQWPGNPLVRLFPNAYVTRGLLATMIVMQIVTYGSHIFRGQIVASGQQRLLARLSSIAAGVSLAIVAVLAAPFGPFAVPTAQILISVVIVVVYLRVLRAWYAGDGPARGAVSTA